MTMLRSIKDQSSYTIVVLGDSRAGKTVLVSQYITGKVKPSYKATIEDCYRTLARLPDGKYKTVNVVDTSGSTEFPAMRELRIKSATAIIVVYNATDNNSINTASSLKKLVQKVREYDGVPICFIGNLHDSSQSKIGFQIPAGVMEDSTCEHFYINLFEQTQCMRLFEQVIRQCYDTNSWKVEIWPMNQQRHDINASKSDSTLKKKRGILSYLSFRRKKSGAVQNSKSAVSLP